MPGVYRVHVDAAMSNFARKFNQSSFIADEVLKPIKVVKESDKYFTYNLVDAIDYPNRLQRAAGTPAVEAQWDVSTSTYQCEEYAEKVSVADRERENADPPLQLDQDSVAFVSGQLKLAREVRVQAAVFNATTFASYTEALTGGDRWDDYSNSDPFSKVETGIDSVQKNSAKQANTIIMGYEVFKSLRHHPDILERIKYTGSMQNPARANATEIAQAFDLERCLVGRAIYNSATEGQTVTPAYVWGKSVMIAYIAPTPPRKDITLGVQFRTRDMRVRRWRDDNIEGTWFEGSSIEDEVIVTAGAGYYITTVVS